MEDKHILINKLRNETGVGIYEANRALNLCGDVEIAKEFLKLYSQAVARYKIINNKKIAYEIEDYVELAKNIVNKR